MRSIGIGTRALTVAIAVMVLVPLFQANAVGQPVGRRIVKESGQTTAFGGGEYVGIRFGLDSLFAVLYGTGENPNSPVLFASINRYLGRATVLDANDAAVAVKRPLVVRTIYAIRLSALLEFNDTNGDGICNVVRLADGLAATDLARHEPVHKAVDLRTAWEVGTVVEAGNASERWRSWTFPITARNLSYVGFSGEPTTGVLEMVQFRFSLMAYLKEETFSVPEFRIKVDATGFGGDQQGSGNEGPGLDDIGKIDADVLSSEEVGEREVTMDVLRYRAKVDHEFRGWDFDPANEHQGLLLETHSTLGNAMGYGMLAWLREREREGAMTYETDEGVETVDENASATDFNGEDAPRRLKHPRIDVNDAWGPMGRLTWTKNVSVTRDGNTTEEQMYYQVQAGRKVSWLGTHGLYTGYYVVGGFSYPGGDTVVHDPVVEAKSYGSEYAREEQTDINEGIIMAILLFILVIVAIPILMLILRRR